MKHANSHHQMGLKLTLLVVLALNFSWSPFFNEGDSSQSHDWASVDESNAKKAGELSLTSSSSGTTETVRDVAPKAYKPGAAGARIAESTAPVVTDTPAATKAVEVAPKPEAEKATTSEPTQSVPAKPTISSADYQANFCNVSHQVILQEKRMQDKVTTEFMVRKSTEACMDCYVLKGEYSDFSMDQILSNQQAVNSAILHSLKARHADLCAEQPDKPKEDFTASHEACETDKEGDPLDNDEKLACNLKKLADLDRIRRDENGKIIKQDPRDVVKEMKRLVSTKIRPAIKKIIKEDLEDGTSLADEALSSIESVFESLDFKNEREEKSLRRDLAKINKELVGVKEYGDLHHRADEMNEGISDLRERYLETYQGIQAGDPRALWMLPGLNQEHSHFMNGLTWNNYYRQNSSIASSESSEFLTMYKRMSSDLDVLLDMNKVLKLNPSDLSSTPTMFSSAGFSSRLSPQSGLGRSYGFSTPVTAPNTGLSWDGFNQNLSVPPLPNLNLNSASFNSFGSSPRM